MNCNHASVEEYKLEPGLKYELIVWIEEPWQGLKSFKLELLVEVYELGCGWSVWTITEVEVFEMEPGVKV